LFNLARSSHRTAIQYWLFLSPAVLFFGICVILPVLQTVWMSLQAWDGTQGVNGQAETRWVGLSHYSELLHDRRFHTSLSNNVIWLALYMLALPLGLVFAILLNRAMRGVGILRALFFFPFVLSQVVVGFIFSWLYDPRNGPIGHLFAAFDAKAPSILGDANLVTYGLIAAGLWPQIAYCGLIYMTGLAGLSRDQLEAARLDGAKRLRLLWYVVLPQLKGATFIAFVVTAIGALRAFDLVAVMTAGGPYGSSRILAYFMFEQALSEYGVRKGYGAAIATVLFLLTLIFMSAFLVRFFRAEKAR